MHHIINLHNNKEYHLPEQLGECTSQQFIKVSKLLYLYQTKKLNLYQFKKACVYALLNMRKSTKKLSELEQLQLDDNLLRLSTLIDSFFSTTEDGMSIIQEFNHIPFNKIPVGFNTYNGPTHHFKNVSFGQYLDALNIFAFYNEFKHSALLLDLLAVFYLPKFGKLKNKSLIKERAHKMRNIHFGYAYGFYLYFAAFQHYLGTAKVPIEGKFLDLSILYKRSQHSSEPLYEDVGMRGTAYVLAESQVFGPMNELLETNMWDILLHMYHIKVRDIEQQSKSEQK